MPNAIVIGGACLRSAVLANVCALAADVAARKREIGGCRARFEHRLSRTKDGWDDRQNVSVDEVCCLQSVKQCGATEQDQFAVSRCFQRGDRINGVADEQGGVRE